MIVLLESRWLVMMLLVSEIGIKSHSETVVLALFDLTLLSNPVLVVCSQQGRSRHVLGK